MIKKIDHIGIAVRSVDEALKVHRDLLGLEFEKITEHEGMRIAFLTAGDVEIELLESTRPGTPIAGFIERKGEGIHHLCFEVDDVEAELEAYRRKGARLIDETPRTGAEGERIAFVHPKSTGGVLVELIEKHGGP
jgi:methylmalonyl-CoA/ethylmalonyl-CoA epimerase